MRQAFANARMYAVTPDIEAAWRLLLAHIGGEAGVEFDYLPYPAPQPLEELWRRPDLGCAFMCGFPIALELAKVTPLASPIPALPWAEGKAVYRSDLIARKDSGIERLEDSFGRRAGWTVDHSHSGFNAFRHHLLAYRTPQRQRLFASVTGNLVTARRILDEIVAGHIDIGPLDAYWHHLLRREKPELFTDIRVVGSTEPVPMPAFVAGPHIEADEIKRLKTAFANASTRPYFPALAERLQIAGFASMTQADFMPLLQMQAAAVSAGYADIA